MDFVLWASRSLHLFSVVVWLGGLMYQAAVALPVARAEHAELSPLLLHLVRRFLPFIWLSAWTILVTGLCLVLFNPRLFAYADRWSMIIAGKGILLVLMMVCSFGFARMFTRVDEMISRTPSADHPRELAPYHQRMNQYARANVALAILAVLLAALLG